MFQFLFRMCISSSRRSNNTKHHFSNEKKYNFYKTSVFCWISSENKVNKYCWVENNKKKNYCEKERKSFKFVYL